MRNSAAYAVSRSTSVASYAFDVLCLEDEPIVEPLIEMRPASPSETAQRTYLVSPKPHAFGEMGRHLATVTKKVDWPADGGDID